MSAIDDVRAGRTEIRWGEKEDCESFFLVRGKILRLKGVAFWLQVHKDFSSICTSSLFDAKFITYSKVFDRIKWGRELPTEEEAKAYAQKFYDRFVVEIEARQKEGVGR